MINQSVLSQHELKRVDEFVGEQGDGILLSLRVRYLDGGTTPQYVLSTIVYDLEFNTPINELLVFMYDEDEANEEFDHMSTTFNENEFGKGEVN